MQKLIIFWFATLSGFANVIVASAGLGGIGTTTVSVSAMVFYFGDTTGDPGFTTTCGDTEATTLGPIRPGFIEIFGSGGGEFGGGSVAVGDYSYRCTFGCALPGLPTPMPFTLGVPFE